VIEPMFGTSADEVAFVIVVAAISFLEIVIGELVPKSLGLRFSDTYSFLVARPLLVLARIMRPLVWFLTACSNVVLRLFGDRTTFTEARLSRDELQQLVEEAAVTGSVDPRASEIASRALSFGEVTVAELMVPRSRVVALPREAPAAEIQRVLLEEGHSRMPVYDGNLDNIVGYIVARDVLALSWEQGLIVLHDIIRPAYTVTEGARGIDTLREMQRRRAQMAIVMDDHGGLAGLVTVEDLVEELVGDIMSEDEGDEPALSWGDDGTALALGSAQVRRVNRELGLALPVAPDQTTLAGVCLALAQGVPTAGARLVAADGTALRLHRAAPPPAVDDEPA
jgi:putative hemolysin